MDTTMTYGSVTSVGVAYPRELSVEDLASHVSVLLGTVLHTDLTGSWNIELVGGANEAGVELAIDTETPHRDRLSKLVHFLSAAHGEMKVSVDLQGFGRVDGVLRPETSVCGLLLDLPELVLYDESNDTGASDIQMAVRRLVLDWYDKSRFEVAFADHEAEFDVDPLDLTKTRFPYALLALSASQGSNGSPLKFYENNWPLSSLGA
jgi:hypothetical protein